MKSPNSDSVSPKPIAFRKDVGKTAFIPEQYAFESTQALLEFIKQFPLAQLITHSDNQPLVTAVPMIDGSDGEQLVLKSHMAGRNQQAKRLVDGQSAMAIFSGPSAYVSPRWFEVKNTVPTWNYVNVQAHGVIEMIDCPEDVYALLKQTIDVMEQSLSERLNDDRKWELNRAPAALVDQLSKAITAFKFRVTRIEGVRRLCQDKDPIDSRNISKGLEQSDSPYDRHIAELISKCCAL